MKIRLYRDVTNQVYNVSVVTEDWSRDDLKLMEQFGEPEVNLGATLTTDPETGEPETFTLPDCYVKLLTDYQKLNMQFDLRDHAQAKAMAEAWQTYIVGEITSVVTALRVNTPDSYEEVTVV